MYRQTGFDKILLTLCTIACAVWFGGTIARYAVAFDLFIPGSAELRPIEQGAQLQVMRLSSNMLVYCLSAYAVMVCSAIILGIRNRVIFRQRGYLFMAFMLMLLALPAEGFLAYHDWRIDSAFPNRFSIAIPNPDVYLKMFVTRFTNYSIIGFLSLLAHATALVIIAWRPLNRTS